MTLKLRTLVKWPARIEGGDLTRVTKENGIVTVDLALSEAAQTAAIEDTSTATVLLVTEGATDDAPDVVERISAKDFITEAGGITGGRQVISGAGLTGGGDLSADRTLAVGTGTGITVNADDVALDTSHARNVDHSAVSVISGAGLTGGGTIASDRTLTVGAGTGITVNADDVALDTAHARNVDHSAVSIIAGAGLTGGGTIASDRTLDVGAGTGIAVNANDVALAAISDLRVMANISGGSAAPVANTLSSIIDTILGDTRGSIIARQSGGWAILTPGTSGHFLKSNGPAADPAYAAVPGGGDLLAANNLTDVASAATAFGNIKQDATASVTGASGLRFFGNIKVQVLTLALSLVGIEHAP